MTDLRQLLHRVFDSEHNNGITGGTHHSKWMMEATNRIEKLELEVKRLKKNPDETDDDDE